VTLLGTMLIARAGGMAEAGSFLRLAILLSLGALIVGATCNAVLTRLALSPIRELESAARSVELGDMDARIRPSRLADADMFRLAAVLNRMLDHVRRSGERQRELTLRALDAEEKARSWVARKLYDECAQSIAATLLRLKVARLRLERAGTEEEELERLRDELLGALEGVRELARELRPPELDEIGFVLALTAHTRSLSERTGLSIQLDAEPVDAELSPEAGLTVYRIVQEALSNAVRHASAGSVGVYVTRSEDGFVAEVHDDGTGFDVEAEIERAGRGLGLLEMQERARRVGGKLSIESSPGAGTRVRLEMPAVLPNIAR
jgi:signal transduction histidine kinase